MYEIKIAGRVMVVEVGCEVGITRDHEATWAHTHTPEVAAGWANDP